MKCYIQRGPLILGTMRLVEKGLREADVVTLLSDSVSVGVDRFHSSNEYESFELFSAAARSLSGVINGESKVGHNVKPAEPHFDQVRFNATRFRSRVDYYLNELATDHIDTIQWMWRGMISDEPNRLSGLDAQASEIGETVQSLRAEDKLSTLVVFPYTTNFAWQCLNHDWCDGFAVYVNRRETNMLDLLAASERSNRIGLAIRPLAAGQILDDDNCVVDELRWVLQRPGVHGAIVGYSSTEHLIELLDSVP